jgi:hypothetical protein
VYSFDKARYDNNVNRLIINSNAIDLQREVARKTIDGPGTKSKTAATFRNNCLLPN